MTIRIRTVAKPYYWGEKSLDGAKYRFQFHWNTYTSKWYMSVKGLNNSISLSPIALLPGKNLFAFGGVSAQLGQLFVVDQTGGGENPNFDDMGTRWTLEYTPLGS